MDQNDTLKSETKKISEFVDRELSKLKEKYLGRDAAPMFGKYAGRPGKIDGIILDGSTICMLIRPYSKVDHSLLWNHRHARTYWPISKIVLL